MNAFIFRDKLDWPTAKERERAMHVLSPGLLETDWEGLRDFLKFMATSRCTIRCDFKMWYKMWFKMWLQDVI